MTGIEPAAAGEIRLKAADGHVLSAWMAPPSVTPRAGLVIAQEMYGVNSYIRDVCAWYAGHGYLAVAPNLYDRVEAGLTFEYSDADNLRAKQLYRNYDWSKAVMDLEAARDFCARAGKVGIVGFCFGGSLAWLAACTSRFDAAVSYYGGEINRYLDLDARCPIECHVGDRDDALDAEKIATFRARHPDVPFHIYPGALHGFDNPKRAPRHHPEAARQARAKSLAFLAKTLSR
jgi:carboxymethylenebutenolidase